MNTGTFDIGRLFGKAFDVYKNNLLLLIGASLVASLLIVVSVGILSGPIYAGLMVLVLKLVDGKEDAQFNNIFESFDSFATTFVLCFVWGLAVYAAYIVLSFIPIVGTLAGIVLGAAFSVFIFFALMEVSEKKMGFQEASKSAFEMLKKDLWMLIAFGFIASLASSVGALACGIGAIITMPLFYVLIATAYRSCSVGGSDEVELDLSAAMEPVDPEPVLEEEPVVVEKESATE